jgi:prolyl oligopeptidase
MRVKSGWKIVVGGVAAMVLAACGEAPAKTIALANPTALPEQAPFEETVFGVKISDPYRWIEDPARLKDMTAWVIAASDSGKAQLAALPGRAKLVETMEVASRAGANYSSVHVAGSRTFALRLDADASIAKLVVREADGVERLLFDPATEGKGGAPVAINNYSVSPSGSVLAIHTAQGGGEVGGIRFMDVTTGAWKTDELKPVWGEFHAVWLGEDAVAYTRMTDKPGGDPMMSMSVRIHRLGAPVEQDKVILTAGAAGPLKTAPVEFPFVTDSEVSDWTVMYLAGARADARVLLGREADLKSGAVKWRDVAGYDDRVNATAVAGDNLFYVTTKAAPNGELRRLDAKSGTLATSDVVIPASDTIISNVFGAADGLYVQTLENGVNGLLFLPGGKGLARKVDIEPASLNDFALTPDGKRLTFSVMTSTRNSRYMIAEGGVAMDVGLASATYAGADTIEAIREEATSADGTRVPLNIVRLKDAQGASPAPTLLEGYASYGEPETLPFYSSRYIVWAERGGIYADCGARGGGDKGRAWHEAGRSANKPNAHADMIACAERLIELKLTDPSHLAIVGTSAGGLLAPPTALKRPELFKVVVPRVAISNATRLAAARNGANQFAEMGDPATEEGFNALLAQDGYVMLDTAKDSPDWFITVGLNDHRVEPWMASKLAARVLEKMGGKHAVFIRAEAEAGHGVGSTRDQTIEEWADIFSFLLNRFGDPDFQLPAR